MTSHTFPCSGSRTWKWDDRASQPLSGMGTCPDPSRKSRGRLLETLPDVRREGAASGKVRMIRSSAIKSPGHQSRITRPHTETLPHATISQPHMHTTSQKPPSHLCNHTRSQPHHQPYAHIPHTPPLTHSYPIALTRQTVPTHNFLCTQHLLCKQ